MTTPVSPSSIAVPPPLPGAPSTIDVMPTALDDRIAAIDILRGVAILGILLMNIQSFAMPLSAYSYPWSWGDMTGANAAVYYTVHVLASGKFISIFAMLFGTGIVLRNDRPGTGTTFTLHLRRMLILAGIGLLHAYLLWYGDILFSYAVLGIAIYFFRVASVRLLWILAGSFYALGLIVNLMLGLLTTLVGQDVAAEFNPPMSTQLQEVAAYQGTWLAQMRERAPIAAMSQTLLLIIYTLPFVGGLMLAGMALMKSGFYAGRFSNMVYLFLAIGGCAAGWSISGLGLWLDAEFGRDPVKSVMLFYHINSLAMPLVAIGYSAAIIGVSRFAPLRLLAPFAAVGRCALSGYLLQTILCTTFFYGHGFGYFGRVDRVGQLFIVLAIWALLLVLAPLWLRFFRQGPAEWVWRCLTYGKLRLYRSDGR